MNKYDMTEFLECCISSYAPSETGGIDPCNIKNLKDGIKKFSIEHKKDIMELFDYSEKGGKYKVVYTYNLIPIMVSYETYHNDFVQFIDSLKDIRNERVDNIDKFQQLIDKAKSTDDNFIGKLFPDHTERMSFTDAVANTEVLIRLSVLSDEIFDNYIRFKETTENTESARVPAVIELYTYDTKKFITKMSELFFDTMTTLFKTKDGDLSTSKPSVGFKLF